MRAVLWMPCLLLIATGCATTSSATPSAERSFDESSSDSASLPTPVAGPEEAEQRYRRRDVRSGAPKTDGTAVRRTTHSGGHAGTAPARRMSLDALE
ncbi:hypothetical protein LZ198_27885 [Myxococcus sp. K15C18031901]|uniref:hypothetical protein n=1 Tax=Myxococcus dinghuensis TaxID=2906761 RepID=UPI0020A75D1B|nr:hypothetical protein [Myxococcus dinghuensis]MCP3102702.1 hypothetical protein [Myxococcus dinghuensis]